MTQHSSSVGTKTVAFQGVSGAYGEKAALACIEGAVPRGFDTFHEVFAAVTAGHAEIGVVPVENSLAGSVHQNVDLLLETDLHVVREIIVRVRHNLLALPGVNLEDVRRVRSHPQALAQCDGFLARHHLQPVAAYDTAGAARELAESGARDEAAIASSRAGELYGLSVLAEGIEDEPYNFTRFLVLSRNEPPRENVPHKTSLVFAVRHTPGFLVETLAELRGLNMTKIESRPRRDRAWSYLIYVDFEGDARDPAIAASLVGVLRKASFVKVIGSYPMAVGVVE
ncbi:prephenate dehydratase [Deinococcus yavapaiensis]|uniref:prephenate dehydratase n=1 Tax=Deinococcus yavapaiensis KR-236 TaxID=694435 RepID=A0A318S7X4_9DEIO|nr:prephenate dehydratase [Deinococcus yavapaiensis]PYE55016.1 prephenate dehydratase [Deinococcus yavapaiensis KR-236]